jgi:hypothetical protein
VHNLFLDESGKPSHQARAVGSGAVAADVYPVASNSSPGLYAT